jgi:hypothetical protein
MVVLTWIAPPGPWWFKVYRAVDDPADYRFLNLTNVPRYEDHLVYPGHRYYYYVTSVLGRDSLVEESAPGNIDSVSFLPADRPVGTIAGIVTDSLSGKPLPFVKVSFYRLAAYSNWFPHALTDSLGRYEAVLDTGSYLVHAVPMFAIHAIPYLSTQYFLKWIPEWYPNARTAEGAEPVAVLEQSTTRVEFDLVPVAPPAPATIRGTVTDSAGAPLPGALVVITRTVQDLCLEAARGTAASFGDQSATVDGLGFMRGITWAGLTDSTGGYVAHVRAGNAYLAMAVKKFYLPEFYQEKSNPADADIIRLAGDTTGIDFSLSLIPAVNNSISGMVRDSNGTGVLSRILLIPRRPRPAPLAVRFGMTDSSGAYLLDHVRRGTYYVLAVPFSDYAPAFYKEGWYGVFHWRDADTVHISGTVENIDVGVVPIRSTGPVLLAGRVEASGVPAKAIGAVALAGAHVLARNATGVVVGYGMTDETGQYTLENIPSGEIRLSVDKEGFEPHEMTVFVGAGEYAVEPPPVTLAAAVYTSVDNRRGVPEECVLEQNYPNPFNPATTIRFGLPAAGHVTLKIFNLIGQEVATVLDGSRPAGYHEVSFDAGRLPSGVYLYRLHTQTGNATRKLVILR